MANTISKCIKKQCRFLSCKALPDGPATYWCGLAKAPIEYVKICPMGKALKIGINAVTHSYILDIEGYLAHQNDYFYRGDSVTGSILDSYSAIGTARHQKRYSLTSDKSYHMVDFNDFIEYATSSLPAKVHLNDFKDKHLSLYDSLPGTYDEPLLLINNGGFSIVGVSLSRLANAVGICCQIKIHSGANSKYQLPFFKNRSNHLINKDHNFPFYFIHYYLLGGKLVEKCRCEVYPPVVLNGDYYGVIPSGPNAKSDKKILNNSLKHYGNKFVKSINMHHLNGYKTDNVINEVGRLMIHLPNYINYMYDIVLMEHRKIRNNPINKKKKSKKKNTTEPIYKLVKSFRVSYVAENSTRNKLKIPKRTWTAPSYSYIVRGHWRKLQHSWSRGRDHKGNVVLGKTWVNQYTKGSEDQIDTPTTDIANPNVTIKLKQTLSYARDKIKGKYLRNDSNNGKSISENNLKVILKIEKPCEQWIYEERIKLTAGLRWLILNRDGYKCTICGRGAEDGVKLEIDHVIPVSKWGKTEEENLRTLCTTCNKGKGADIIR